MARRQAMIALRITLALLIAVPVSAGAAFAFSKDTCAGKICVSDAWARATPPGASTAAVYFTLLNKGSASDALVSASSSVTPNAMVHRTVVTQGVARMEMSGRVELAAGAHVTFAPVGYHLMLDGLKQRLTEGSMISVTLDFAKAGKITFPVPVVAITAAGPPHVSAR